MHLVLKNTASDNNPISYCSSQNTCFYEKKFKEQISKRDLPKLTEISRFRRYYVNLSEKEIYVSKATTMHFGHVVFRTELSDL